MKRELTAKEAQEVLEKLELYLNDLKNRWDHEKTYNENSWFTISRSYILKATIFIVSILDELITFVEPIIPEGSDKKIAVMAVVNKLFDHIVTQAFPLWLKPFAETIKSILVGIIISHLIDFIVEKYKSGYWKLNQDILHKEDVDGKTNEITQYNM